MALTPEQLRKLARIQNRRTLYEAVIIRPDGERCLLAYIGRKNKSGMLEAISRRAESVCTFLGAPERAEITFKTGSLDFAITGGGKVEFSGRTQRDAILAGELPYVGRATATP